MKITVIPTKGTTSMLNKILIYTDRHKRWNDFETITNYLEMTSLISKDILRFVKENNITHAISTGDLYDKGYREVGPMYKDCLDDIILSNALNGNHYLCLGNHLFLDRDSNPELYLIQPDDVYKPKKKTNIDTQILKRKDYIVIGNVQISMFHFSQSNKNYIRKREPGVKYHIGVYHDDSVIPVSARQKFGLTANTSNEYLSAIYEDIDFAIVGHIHTKIGYTEVLTMNKKIPVYIPGALTITQNKASEIHSDVQLPVITIDDEDPNFPLTIDLHTFSLHTDVLSFYKPKVKTIPAMDNLETKAVEESIVKSTKITSYLDAEEYLQMKGLDQRAISIFRLAAADNLTVDDTVSITYNKKRC